MSDFQNDIRHLVDRLELKYAPVGITLFGEDEAPPARYPFYEENFKSYCQALVLAGQGRALLLKRENMGCKLGTSVLGMETEMEAFLMTGCWKNTGSVCSPPRRPRGNPVEIRYLPQGKTQSALIAPLGFSRPAPGNRFYGRQRAGHVAPLRLNYEKGGRQDLPQSGGALGWLRDITAYPLLEGQANNHLSGPGLPDQIRVAPSDLMLAFPACNWRPCIETSWPWKTHPDVEKRPGEVNLQVVEDNGVRIQGFEGPSERQVTLFPSFESLTP